MINKLNLVQTAIKELLDEVKVRDWEEADDAQVQKAMNRMTHWEGRRLEIGKNFVEYKGLVQNWNTSDMSQEGSGYKNTGGGLQCPIPDNYRLDQGTGQGQEPWNLGKGSYQPDWLSSVEWPGHPMVLQVGGQDEQGSKNQ